ncbi:histidine kinase [Bifidobacterium aquikefiricola]|uniref:Histidine kinase n=1 Tax=Bifidobacterium aquikefiricola TaxID=3059038 RepID=A0AB39U9I1_9BIFI
MIQDILSGTLITALFVLLADKGVDYNGLLFRFPAWAMIPWTIALGVPLLIRRTYPQTAALIFVVCVLLHLILGPSALSSDIASLMLLYSVIVYGNPKNTHHFLFIAGAMGLLTIMVGAVSESFGPLLSPLWYTSAKAETFACTLRTQAFFDADCTDSLKRVMLVLGIAVFISLISVILMAYWQRARRHSIQLLQERNKALLSRQDEERQIAVLAERARIARDMHDVVAHTLSSIIVQSDAGRYAGKHDVDIARMTMRNIESEGRSALSGMQSLLGTITVRDDGSLEENRTAQESADASSSQSHEGEAAARRETAAELSDSRDQGASQSTVHDSVTQSVEPHAGLVHESSVDSARSALPSTTYADIPMLISHENAISPQSHVSRHISGKASPDMLTADCQETLFRVVEEALSNVRKHAGSVVQVVVDEQWSDHEIRLTIRDNGRGKHASEDGHAPGFGLLGMRERVEACNGSFHAGALATAGFELVVTLPLTPLDNEKASGFKSFIHQVQLTIDLFRSQPLHVHDSDHSRKPNPIERFSQWTQRHYVLVDTIGAIIIWAFFLVSQLSNKTYLFYSSSSASPSSMVLILVTCVMALPLCTRRRFPFITAVFVAVCCTVQLLFVPGAFAVNIYAVVYLSSAIMYGRRSHMVKLLSLATLDSVLLGMQTYFATADTGRSLIDIARDAMLGISMNSDVRSVRDGLVTTLYMLLLCGGSAACALWVRARGNNVLVLQEREEAILLEQQRQMVLSADNERNRIASIIQQEVTDTLMSVVNQAEHGLQTIDALYQNNMAGKSADLFHNDSNEGILDEAFGAIGRQGRTALAHMRTLLGVLRTTGFSDADSKKSHAVNGGLPSSELKPAASLDVQLHDAKLHDAQLRQTLHGEFHVQKSQHANQHNTVESATKESDES